MSRAQDQTAGSRQESSGPSAWPPLLILAAATALILLFNLDLRFQHLFFDPEKGWWLLDQPLLHDIYTYGTWPAIVLVATAGLTTIAALAVRRLRPLLRPAIFMLLVMGLGPGLLVNGLFKAQFGRPRPNALTEFGRYQEFLPLLKKGEAQTGASFPSGHAAMGFYLMSPFFLLLARRRNLARLILAGGLAAGCLMGLARICVGDHFLGDVLWSGGLVYLSGVACYYLLRFNRQPVEQDGP